MENQEKKRVVEEEELKEGINLFVQEVRSADAVVPIRWCINKETYQELEEKKIENPHLLLVVKATDKTIGPIKEESRKLVPLDQMMEYVQFQYPGWHQISATVVWSTDGDLERLKKFFLDKSSVWTYYNSVLDYDMKNLRSSFHYYFPRIGEGNIRIYVDKRFFAKKKPGWLSNWVNMWFEWRPIDQCQFRRRCILAFTIQPILVLLWLTVKFCSQLCVALVLLLCLTRRINFSSILHPFQDKFEELWTGGDSFFFRKDRSFIAPFAPIFLLVNLLALLTVDHRFKMSLTTSDLLLTNLCLIVFCSLLIALFVIFSRWISSASEALERKKYKLLLPGEQIEGLDREALQRKVYERRFSPIICSGEELKSSLSALPKEKRTFHLLYLDVKAKVCKPFARS